MVGFVMRGSEWEVGVNLSGQLEVRWFDPGKWQSYGFRTGANIVPQSAVAISGIKADGSGAKLDDPALRYVFFGVYTQDGSYWHGGIDMDNWGKGFWWSNQNLVNTSGNWNALTGPEGEAAMQPVDLSSLKDRDGNPIPTPPGAK